MDRVDEWRLFAEVAGARSFRAAARTHRVSPQAVTRAIAALEARLGRRLLNRTTRSVSLTDAGARYLERCRRLLADVDALDAPDAADVALRGRLTITAPVLFGQLHVVPIVADFLAAHAGVEVQLVLGDRIASLADEGIDLAIRIGALPDSTLRARAFGAVRLIACASPAYLARAGTPRDPGALARHACIAFTATTPIADRWAFPGAAGQHARSVRVRPRLVVDTAAAAIEAAVAGVGIVRVLSYQVDAVIAAKRLRPVLERHEPAPRPVHLVHLPGAQVRLADAFAELAFPRLRARLG